MSNDQQPAPSTPTGGWGGEYDADATAFIQLPGSDPGVGPGESPLAAPGAGPDWAPPVLGPMTPAASLDPASTGHWTLPFADAGPEPASPEESGPPPDEQPQGAAMGQGAAAALAGSHEARTQPAPGVDWAEAPPAGEQWPAPGGGQPQDPYGYAPAGHGSGVPLPYDLPPPRSADPGAPPGALSTPAESAPLPNGTGGGHSVEGFGPYPAPGQVLIPGQSSGPPAGAPGADPVADLPAEDAPGTAAADGPADGAEPDGRDGAEGPDELEAPADADRSEADDEHPLASYLLHVNGADRPVTDAWIGESLLYVLRERLGLAGAKDGCSQGECGACSVQVDGRLVASCLVPGATAAGSEIRTVEGLSVDGNPSDVQRALAERAGVQCGFCVPGMAMTVHDLLAGNHAPTELEMRKALCGNLCRCSGYRGVLEAVREVATGRATAARHAATDGRNPHGEEGPQPQGDGPDGSAEPAGSRIPQQAGPGDEGGAQ